MKVKNALAAVGKEVIIKKFNPVDRELELEGMVYTIGKVGTVTEVMKMSDGQIKMKVRFPDTFWWYYNDMVKFKNK